jgi:hypothetical protein
MTTTVDKESVVANLELWIAALRSGKYKQAHHWLRKGDSFCCLGVACDLINPTEWVRACGMYRLANDSATMLPFDIKRAFGLDGFDESRLVAMNDGERSTFAEIADYIEKTILPRVRSEQEKSA